MAVQLSEEQRIQLRRERRARQLWKRCGASCRFFISRFVRIENKDAVTTGGDIVIPFTMWPAQIEALRVFLTERLVIALKARQLGLSWLALAYAVWRMLFFPGYSAILISKREDDTKELVDRVRFILDHLPRWMVRSRDEASQIRKQTSIDFDDMPWPIYEVTSLSVTIYHPSGQTSTFTGMTASPTSGRSFTANLVILDEWAYHQFAHEIWDSAYPTVNRPTGGQVIGISTADMGTLFEEIWNDAMRGENDFFPLFLPWHTDPRRTREWYEQTKRNMPNTYRREYPSTPEEAFTAGAGAFFPEWDYDIHVINEPGWYPPKGWRIVGGYDPGFSSRACFKWYAIAPDGSAVCYREYYPTQTTDEDQARTIIRMSRDPDGFPERISYIVGGLDCWTPNKQTGESTFEVFARVGRQEGFKLNLVQAQTDLANGWRRLHSWLKPFEDPVTGEKKALLRFTPACANTIRTYPAIKQSKTDPEDVAPGSEDHPQDVDRYFVMSRPRPGVDEKEIRARARRRQRYVEPVVSETTGY